MYGLSSSEELMQLMKKKRTKDRSKDIASLKEYKNEEQKSSCKREKNKHCYPLTEKKNDSIIQQ